MPLVYTMKLARRAGTSARQALVELLDEPARRARRASFIVYTGYNVEWREAQGRGGGPKADTSGASEATLTKPGARTGEGLFRLNSLSVLR